MSCDPPRRPSQPQGLLRPIFPRVSLIIYKLVLPFNPFPLRISHPASCPWGGSRGSQGVAPYAVLVPRPVIMMKNKIKRNVFWIVHMQSSGWREKRTGMSTHSFFISPIMLGFSPTGQNNSNTSSRRLSRRCSCFSFAFKPEIVFRNHDIDRSEMRPSPLGRSSKHNRVRKKNQLGQYKAIMRNSCQKSNSKGMVRGRV